MISIYFILINFVSIVISRAIAIGSPPLLWVIIIFYAPLAALRHILLAYILACTPPHHSLFRICLSLWGYTILAQMDQITPQSHRGPVLWSWLFLIRHPLDLLFIIVLEYVIFHLHLWMLSVVSWEFSWFIFSWCWFPWFYLKFFEVVNFQKLEILSQFVAMKIVFVFDCLLFSQV